MQNILVLVQRSSKNMIKHVHVSLKVDSIGNLGQVCV